MPADSLPGFTALLLLFVFAGSPALGIDPPPPRSGDAVALVGDSITNHGDWPKVLRRSDVTNWGKPGYTTGQLAWTFKDLVARQPGLKVVFLQGGINDLTLGIPPDRIYRNQVDAIKYWRERDVKPVLEAIIFKADDPETNAIIAALNQRLRLYCENEGVEFLDPNAVLSVDGHLRMELTTDGTHLKPDAYVLWANLISAQLDRLH